MCVVSSLCTAVSLSSAGCPALCMPSDAQLVRSSKNSVIIFQPRSLALQPHKSLLNLAVQQTKGLGLTWKILIRTVSYTSHKPMYKVNKDGFNKPFEMKPT